MKKATQESEEARKERVEAKQNFRVMTNSQYEALQSHKNVRNDLFKDVHTIIPTSCFVELMDSKQKKCKQLLQLAVPTLNDLAKCFKDSCDPELDLAMLNHVFTDSLLLSDDQIKRVYENTQAQSNSQEWFSQSCDRLTASKFKEIFNCAKRLKSHSDPQCPEELVAKIMGYIKPPQTWQMKHGINTEIHANEKYKQLVKKSHKNVKVKEPGMTVLQPYPFISVSPDLEVICSCHGPGLVEIKCPASLIGKVPSIENYHHLELSDGQIKLKRNSEYYFQIQGQMAVTQRMYGDFFIFSFAGNATVRLDFDEKFWLDMLHHFNWFWRNFIAPEFLTEELKRNLDRLCPENEIVAVKNKNFNDMSTAIHEQTDPVPLLKEEFFNDVIDIIHEE